MVDEIDRGERVRGYGTCPITDIPRSLMNQEILPTDDMVGGDDECAASLCHAEARVESRDGSILFGGFGAIQTNSINGG